MRSRTARIVVVAVLAGTSLGACSDEQTKEQFVAAADDLCREADQQIGEMGQPRVGDDVLEYVEQAKAIADELVADLRELDPPEGDRAQADAMIDALDRSADLLEPLAHATVEQDRERLAELQQEVDETTDDVSEAAESYGFEVCGAKVLDPVR